MPKNRKVNTLDSYATIRAVARTKPVPGSPPSAPAGDDAVPSDTTTDPQKLAQDFRVLRPTWSDPAERDKLRQDARQRIQELNAGNGGPPVKK